MICDDTECTIKHFKFSTCVHCMSFDQYQHQRGKINNNNNMYSSNRNAKKDNNSSNLNSNKNNRDNSRKIVKKYSTLFISLSDNSNLRHCNVSTQNELKWSPYQQQNKTEPTYNLLSSCSIFYNCVLISTLQELFIKKQYANNIIKKVKFKLPKKKRAGHGFLSSSTLSSNKY